MRDTLYEFFENLYGGRKMNYRELQDSIIQKYRMTIETNSKCRQRMHVHPKQERYVSGGIKIHH